MDRTGLGWKGWERIGRNGMQRMRLHSNGKEPNGKERSRLDRQTRTAMKTMGRERRG